MPTTTYTTPANNTMHMGLPAGKGRGENLVAVRIACSDSKAYRNVQYILLSASVGGRTSIIGLLIVIFYFYIFIHQRLGADTAMNSLPAAILDR